MGQTGFCKNLRFVAVIPRKSEICKNQRKSAKKNCEFGSVCPFLLNNLSLLFPLDFWSPRSGMFLKWGFEVRCFQCAHCASTRHTLGAACSRMANFARRVSHVRASARRIASLCNPCNSSPAPLEAPAAILFISRDTCSDRIAKLFRACFHGVSHNYRAIRCKTGYRTDVPV